MLLALLAGMGTASAAGQPSPTTTVAVRRLPDEQAVRSALPLFETDDPNTALACATGTYTALDHREQPCTGLQRRAIPLDTWFGEIRLTAVASRTGGGARRLVPRTGYRLFVALPLTEDPVHRSRGAV